MALSVTRCDRGALLSDDPNSTFVAPMTANFATTETGT